jgi:hypothetical protein
VRSLSAERLLRLPVRLDGLEVGHAVDLILDPAHGRALGFDVLCRDDLHRFLPLAAAQVGASDIRPSSAFALVDDAGFEFYRGRTSSLRALKGSQVARGGKEVGALLDVVVTPEGEIEAFVVSSADGTENILVEPGISLVANGHDGSG